MNQLAFVVTLVTLASRDSPCRPWSGDSTLSVNQCPWPRTTSMTRAEWKARQELIEGVLKGLDQLEEDEQLSTSGIHVLGLVTKTTVG